jgi:hypothetical protein
MAEKARKMALWGVLGCVGAVLGVVWGVRAVGAVEGVGGGPGGLDGDSAAGGITEVADCAEFEITEVFTNYKNDQSEQFVEFLNPTAETLSLQGCVVRTKYSNKVLEAVFGEVSVGAGEYRAYSLQSLGLRVAKAPKLERVMELWDGLEVVDGDGGGAENSGGEGAENSGGAMVLAVELAGLPKSSAGKAWALVDGEWVNATPTPSADNLTAPEFIEVEPEVENEPLIDSEPVAEQKTEALKVVAEPEPVVAAEVGPEVGPEVEPKIVSEIASGVGDVVVDEAAENKEEPEQKQYADCGEGRYRNPETNRCKKVETEAAKTLTPCAVGYERNPETNRCKKVAVASGLVPCAEGYERNPETNRCRKVRENTGVAAGFGVPDSGGDGSEVGGDAAGVLGAVGAVFQGDDGQIQGWRVVLAAVGVLVVLAVICWVLREKLRKIAIFARVFDVIQGFGDKIRAKLVQMLTKNDSGEEADNG